MDVNYDHMDIDGMDSPSSDLDSIDESTKLHAIRERGVHVVPGSSLFERFPAEARATNLERITCSGCGSRSTNIKPCSVCSCPGDDRGRCPQCTGEHDQCRVCTDDGYNTEVLMPDESEYHQGFWTEAMILRVVELKNSGWSEPKIAQDVGATERKVGNLWRTGQTDVRRFTNELKRVPLKDCVHKDGLNQGELLDRYQQDHSLDGIAKPMEGGTHARHSGHKTDFRLMNPGIKNIFTERTPGGNFGFPDTCLPAQKKKKSGSGPGVRNACVGVLERQLTIAASEMFREQMPIDLLRLTAPDRMRELEDEQFLNDEWDEMTHEERQSMNRQILYGLGFVHPEDMPDPKDPSGECVNFLNTVNPSQTYSDEKHELFESLRDANYYSDQLRIDSEIEAAREMVSFNVHSH